GQQHEALAPTPDRPRRMAKRKGGVSRVTLRRHPAGGGKQSSPDPISRQRQYQMISTTQHVDVGAIACSPPKRYDFASWTGGFWRPTALIASGYERVTPSRGGGVVQCRTGRQCRT